jgi:hypothetical protein
MRSVGGERNLFSEWFRLGFAVRLRRWFRLHADHKFEWNKLSLDRGVDIGTANLRDECEFKSSDDFDSEGRAGIDFRHLDFCAPGFGCEGESSPGCAHQRDESKRFDDSQGEFERASFGG